MSAVVIIPHGFNDDSSRVRARYWIAARYDHVHRLAVTMAPCPQEEFSKGLAFNPALARSTADVVIMSDADSFVDHEHLAQAIEIAERDGWAMPHSTVKRLNRVATEITLSGGHATALEQRAYPALPGGGIVIARRDVWQAVNGVDPRYVGWGGEDHALGLALMALVGPVNKRRAAPLWHLWHEPAKLRYTPSQNARDLDARYRAARKDVAVMADLTREWRLDDSRAALATADTADAHIHN